MSLFPSTSLPLLKPAILALGKAKKAKQAESPKVASQPSRRKKGGIDKSMISSPSAFKVGDASRIESV